MGLHSTDRDHEDHCSPYCWYRQSTRHLPLEPRTIRRIPVHWERLWNQATMQSRICRQVPGNHVEELGSTDPNCELVETIIFPTWSRQRKKLRFRYAEQGSAWLRGFLWLSFRLGWLDGRRREQSARLWSERLEQEIVDVSWRSTEYAALQTR
jgi:hypothetical protein